MFRLQSLPWAAALRFEAETDLHEFESALAEQRHDTALAAYRGDLLAGVDDGRRLR